MLKLFSLKNQQKDGGSGTDQKGAAQKKASAAQLRLTKGNKVYPLLYLY